MGEAGVQPSAVLIGHPVAHSLSPDIFAILANESDTPFRYTLRNVSPGTLKDTIGELSATPGLVGANVTVPYKREVLDHVSAVSPEVAVIGAANTLVRTDGGFTAYNTDVSGFAMMLDHLGYHLEGASILVLGAGGAARAVVSVLSERKVGRTIIFNRSSDRLEQICTLDPNRIVPYNDSVKDQAIDLIVHCTSLGLEQGDVETIEGFLRPVVEPHSGVPALDLVYAPSASGTTFMQMARQCGLNPVSDGLPMLIGQAMKAWELWTKHSLNNVGLRDILKRLRK
ncbi:MAG: shikimate dehydrogenase [Myxococcales bacterium]|nr:shikimate dehydrogenase [Myxococcales bacterium]